MLTEESNKSSEPASMEIEMATVIVGKNVEKTERIEWLTNLSFTCSLLSCLPVTKTSFSCIHRQV